jgi:hypothetical protein
MTVGTSATPATQVRARTQTTLVIGADAGARETAIAAAVAPPGTGRSGAGGDAAATTTTAIILEGLPAGIAILEMAQTAAALAGAPLTVVRIAPGCLCCSGNMIMRVTLNRILRQAPANLFISLANANHLAQIRAFLTQPPYDDWLTLNAELGV